MVYQAEALVVTLVLRRMRPFESDELKHWRGSVTTLHASQFNLNSERNKHRLIAHCVHSCRRKSQMA